MIGRRMFLGGAFGLCACACSQATAKTRELYAGCTVPSKKARQILASNSSNFTYKSHIEGTTGSGDKGFDRALAKTLVRLSDLFEVLPGFAFQDLEEENAYATNRDKFGNRDDGTVIFSRSLFRSIMARPENPHICVAAVCAHEFAHILQFKTGVYDRLVSSDKRVKRLELHADFLAGYFAGKRKKENGNFPAAAFASMQFSIGDNGFGDIGHHGTNVERGRAVVQGFNSGFHNSENLSTAIETGVRYVRNI